MSRLRERRRGSRPSSSGAPTPTARSSPSDAERLARLCHLMAERFARGGRLIAFGARRRRGRTRATSRSSSCTRLSSASARCRRSGWPARAATAGQVALIARPDDIAIAFGADEDGGEAARALARPARGCLTLAFAPAGAEWEFEPPTGDPDVRQELVETLYHVLWELVHVFFDHRGLLEGRTARRIHDAGASSFLYPFLAEQEDDLDPCVDDVRRSVLMKAEEIAELRARR